VRVCVCVCVRACVRVCVVCVCVWVCVRVSEQLDTEKGQEASPAPSHLSHRSNRDTCGQFRQDESSSHAGAGGGGEGAFGSTFGIPPSKAGEEG
jgi:hypothetical protein